ncbi:MAG TPA: outer membrane beta-barrel protein [Acidobacteriaceae bacterium]|nr:outer membrane beta-barrel protein [Acidobacteriaceae bacterium]
MQKTRLVPASFLAIVIALASTHASAQTSIALSGYGAFSGTTTGDGTQQSPANQAGGLFELRHISNPIFGFEGTYSFNRANQTYTTDAAGIACPSFGCSISTETVRSNAHEVTADWTPSLPIANFRPFGVLGVGLLLDVPSDSQATVVTTSPCGATTCPGSPTTTTSTSPTQTSYKAVYVYGAGLDWGLIPHIGLRLQYRGNLYSAPNVSKLFTSTDSFTHTAEPMVGIYFKL